MTKKKSFISLVLAFCLIIPAMFLLSACGGNNTRTLKSDDGIAVVGEFEEGAELTTDKVEVSSGDATTILSKLEVGNIVITSTDNAMIYDIFVSKDDQKVQPNGKVAVSVPVKESKDGYKVFHIKGDNTIEELSATYKDGILTFETSSFSYYVIVPTGDVTINNPTPDTGDDTPTAETIWTNAITTWQGATNVKVMERTSSPDDDTNGSARIKIFQIQNNKYSYDIYEEKEGKGSKPSWYYVKDGNNYFYYEGNDDGSGWYKTSNENTKNEYEGALKNIYECLDLNNNKIEFSYEKFDYDLSTQIYKYKANNNITVKLNFVNGNYNIVIKSVGDGKTCVRTITFDAVVDVPTTNIIDQTTSK